METKEKKSQKKTSGKSTSWFDKVSYSQMWFQLIFKATSYRMEERNNQYVVAVDSLIRTLLKNERDPIKERRKELLDKANYGFDAILGIYDELLEDIVDILEDNGYLTKQFVIETFTGEIDGIDD